MYTGAIAVWFFALEVAVKRNAVPGHSEIVQLST
jgi:hypothetical protein